MRKTAITTSIFIVLIFACFALKTATAEVQAKRCTLTITNRSNRDIYRLHLSWNRDKNWGPNLLESALKPQGEISRAGIVAADYDLLVVDSSGSQCIMSVQIHSDTSFTITEQSLGGCRRN